MPEEKTELPAWERREEDSIREKKNQPPKGVPDKPEAGKFEGPVAWLGGRELIANLKLIALYTIFGNKLDSRDWMTGIVYLCRDESLPNSGLSSANQDIYNRMRKVGVYTRAVETTQAGGKASEKEFWFDYIADTGDGQMATYNIAYIAMRDWSLKSKDEKEVWLPRGKFLVIGGDTAYHVADYETLAKRFQAPFWWAYKELVKEKEISNAERRPLFGIPANHDYYDALDGFNRQFRRPITGEIDESMSEPQLSGEGEKGPREPQLRLPTFERHQESSYVALHLPYDWWFWGLDTENDEIDFRQQEFFQKVNKGCQPKKLIVATPSPTTVFGKYLSGDKKLAEVFKAVGLKRPFLREKGDQLTPGECRLDLSGDIHHYARYWGPDSDETDKPRANQRGDHKQDTRYASVVSGGGGAFFDPTNTYFGEIKEQALFPTEAVSRDAMSKKLLDFSQILRGGSVHIIGAVIAFVMCYAATFVPKTQPIEFRPLVDSIVSFGMAGVLISLLLLLVGNLFLAKTLRAVTTWSQKKPAQEEKSVEEEEREKKKTALMHTLVISVFVVVTSGLMGLGISWVKPFRLWSPLINSLMVFLALVWSILMTILYMQYTERLNQKAKNLAIENWEFYPTHAMLIAPLICFGSTLWFFGKSSVPAYLVAEVVVLTTVTVSVVGISLLAVLVGGERHDWKKGGKVGYLFIGLWHALLQLIVPSLWVLSVVHLWVSERLEWNIAVIGVLLVGVYHAFRWFGIRKLRRNHRRRLLAAWIVYGLLMILPPALYLYRVGGEALDQTLGAWQPVWWLILCFIAAVMGLYMSCVWFGWYLAVTMAYNGHNNEAGGAARLEGYKQFIRIRLTNDDLTAYVIGFDKALADGKELKNEGNLRIVDQFKLSID